MSKRRRTSARTLRAILRHSNGGIGLAMLGLLALTAIFAPLIAPLAPDATQFQLRFHPPSAEALFGTDHLGRDIFSRIVWGARLSILSGIGALLVGSALGVTIGVAAGYLGRWPDRVLMRVVDVLLAFPTLLLALIVVAILGPGGVQTVIAIGFALVAPFARIARGEVIRIREWDFVYGAKALGAKDVRVVLQHVLPNVLSPLIVYATLRFGVVILTEASLGFLGLGPSSPSPAWGLMVNEGLRLVQRAWWVAIVPGLAILFTVLAANLLGDALRDVLDPRTGPSTRASRSAQSAT